MKSGGEALVAGVSAVEGVVVVPFPFFLGAVPLPFPFPFAVGVALCFGAVFFFDTLDGVLLVGVSLVGVFLVLAMARDVRLC
jgi:hypothetical protein